MSVPTKSDFINTINQLKIQSRTLGYEYIEILSSDLHRNLGSYPGPNHRMASCCDAMYDSMDVTTPLLFISFGFSQHIEPVDTGLSVARRIPRRQLSQALRQKRKGRTSMLTLKEQVKLKRIMELL
jgi:hypothetical protein